MSEKLVLIDLSGIAHPIWHVNDGAANPNATSIAIVERIRAMASAHRHSAICCDSGKSFRADIDPTYKAQRPESDARLMHQIGLAVETLRGDGFPIWSAKGFEADDLIATAVDKLNPFKVALPDGSVANVIHNPYDVLIISPDKDLRQLVSDRVEVLAPGIADRPSKTYDAEAVFLRHGVQPHQLLDYLALVGDKSDNIIGARGIGEKTAARLLNQFGNLDDMFAAIDRGGADIKESGLASLAEFRTRMETVRSLIRLRTDAPIEFEQIFRERVPQDVAVFSEGDDVSDDIDYAMQSLEGDDNAEVKPTPETDASSEVVGFPHAIIERDGRGVSDGIGGTRKENAAVDVGRTVRDVAPKATQSVVVQPAPAEWERQLEPRNMIEAIKLATILFQSKLFSQWGTEAECLATILAGRELGVQSLASLRGFHKIDGKPTMSASLMRGLVLQSRKQEYFQCIERTNDRATFKTLRKGNPQPTELTYTVDDARKAWTKSEASWNGSGWVKNPADMCAARASSKLARLEYDDVLFGLYATEEFD